MRSTCASGCGGSDDLGVLSVPFRLMFFGMSIVRQSNAEISGVTYRNACRACASCYGAFRSWKFPSLYRGQSRSAGRGCGRARGVLMVG
jgi:hypothetical protein